MHNIYIMGETSENEKKEKRENFFLPGLLCVMHFIKKLFSVIYYKYYSLRMCVPSQA